MGIIKVKLRPRNKNKELYQFIRNNLQNIKDLDKILKLSLLQKLTPKSM